MQRTKKDTTELNNNLSTVQSVATLLSSSKNTSFQGDMEHSTVSTLL